MSPQVENGSSKSNAPKTVAVEHLVGELDLSSDKGVLAIDWVKELAQSPGIRPVLTTDALICETTDLSPDHMFAAFIRGGLVHDLLSLYNEDEKCLYAILSLGDNICGHPKTVHGGLTSAIIDENIGVLNYILKRDRIVPHGPSFTVHLEVDYRKPIPAGSHVLCISELEKAEGRKCWVKASIWSRPNGDLYAEGKALFVIPKSWNPPLKDSERKPGQEVETESELERVAQRRASTGDEQ
eukprot:jgi/Botrbrau1/2393/Bobra.0395s0025.1